MTARPIFTEKFTGNFTQQEPLPQESITAATNVLNHGRLHRYNTLPDEIAETALLEQEFAEFTKAKYCLAVASCGYALTTALRALNVRPNDPILTNAFTLAPVPGAIAATNARPIFVETTENLTLNLTDLQTKIRTSNAKILLLSHMRGHIADMEAITQICKTAQIQIIEDCAHTMGATWNGVASGRFGAIGCYSTQTFKHINSGEGGLMITDNPEIMARATMLSGSYMFYDTHIAGADPANFTNIALDTPNCSGRMDNLRAAILRPQLARLPAQIIKWNALYRVIETALAGVNHIAIPTRPPAESIVGSSFQFRLPNATPAQIRDFITRCAARGVVLKWFGADAPQGFTSDHKSWRYVTAQTLPDTDAILAGLVDMRLPLTFTPADCAVIAGIICDELGEI